MKIFLGLLFINRQEITPLQLFLQEMMMNIEDALQNMDNMPSGVDFEKLPTESARMAMCMLAAGPMLFVFPFFQKYFVKGLSVGAIKG